MGSWIIGTQIIVLFLKIPLHRVLECPNQSHPSHHRTDFYLVIDYTNIIFNYIEILYERYFLNRCDIAIN